VILQLGDKDVQNRLISYGSFWGMGMLCLTGGRVNKSSQQIY